MLAEAHEIPGVVLGRRGRREEALQPAQEAVELYRALAARNRDIFVPELARSLSNLANRLNALGQPVEALASFAEAVRLLTPQFKALPGAHRRLMEGLAAEYRRLAQTLGQAPDAGLLEPALARIEALRMD